MSIRKVIAGFALAGAVTFGGAGIASAQTDPASPPFPKHPNVTCQQAVEHTAKAQAHLDHIKGRIADAKVRRDRLVAEGKYEQAQHLTDLIQKAETWVGDVQQHLTQVEKVVRDRCAPADGADATAAS